MLGTYTMWHSSLLTMFRVHLSKVYLLHFTFTYDTHLVIWLTLKRWEQKHHTEVKNPTAIFKQLCCFAISTNHHQNQMYGSDVFFFSNCRGTGDFILCLAWRRGINDDPNKQVYWSGNRDSTCKEHGFLLLEFNYLTLWTM